MGMWPLPDDPPEWGDDLLYVFPPGQTPKYIYATFFDITRRPTTPYEGQYNATFQLVQLPGDPSTYQYTSPAQMITLTFFSTYTTLYFEFAASYGVFWQTNPKTGAFYFTSQYVYDPPATAYYGGKCRLSWIPPGEISIQEAANLFGIEPSPTMRAQAFPDTEDTVIFGFADDETLTKLRIKKSLT